jgi:hypothetical protein
MATKQEVETLIHECRELREKLVEMGMALFDNTPASEKLEEWWRERTSADSSARDHKILEIINAKKVLASLDQDQIRILLELDNHDLRQQLKQLNGGNE